VKAPNVQAATAALLPNADTPARPSFNKSDFSCMSHS